MGLLIFGVTEEPGIAVGFCEEGNTEEEEGDRLGQPCLDAEIGEKEDGEGEDHTGATNTEDYVALLLVGGCSGGSCE